MKALQFSVSVSEVNTYSITEDEFNTINEVNNLGLDFNNLSDDDIETIYSYLECNDIVDTNTMDLSFFYDHEILES
jgi:hypothetical protein